jgi:hypothetical protein
MGLIVITGTLDALFLPCEDITRRQQSATWKRPSSVPDSVVSLLDFLPPEL